MAALTADRNTEYSLGDLLVVPVACGRKIWAGSLVCVNEEGFAVPAENVLGNVFVGVATARADNKDGESGAVSVIVRRRGRYLFNFCGGKAIGGEGYHARSAVRTDMCARVFAVDDNTVCLGADKTQGVFVGVIADIEDANEVWVVIDGAVMEGRW